MTDILRAILAWVEWVIAEAGYPGLALAMLLETVFPPIPSEAILPFAGVLARRGTFDLAGIVVAATLGSVAGALILYGVGRWVEDHVVVALVRRYGRWIGLSEATLARAAVQAREAADGEARSPRSSDTTARAPRKERTR